MPFVIACSVRGGVTGHRTAYAKNAAGRVAVFDDRQAAENEAARYRSWSRQVGGFAIHAYDVEEVDEIPPG